MLSPPEQILLQLLLRNTTTCLTQLVTTFFVFQMQKSLSKKTTESFIPQRNAKQT